MTAERARIAGDFPDTATADSLQKQFADPDGRRKSRPE
jgi:hypothetical protein